MKPHVPESQRIAIRPTFEPELCLRACAQRCSRGRGVCGDGVQHYPCDLSEAGDMRLSLGTDGCADDERSPNSQIVYDD
jgi:hypothetical protein